MSSTEYMVICYVAAALCILSLLITLFIFFKLNIPGVIGDLSGTTARKGIESIRNENARTGNKAHKTSHINRERGRLTDKITPSGNLSSQGEKVDLSVGTEKFSTGKLFGDGLGSETTVLSGYNNEETTVLTNGLSEETTILDTYSMDETTVLANSYGEETTVLSYNRAESNLNSVVLLADVGIVVEDEIVFVHSDERIN